MEADPPSPRAAPGRPPGNRGRTLRVALVFAAFTGAALHRILRDRTDLRSPPRGHVPNVTADSSSHSYFSTDGAVYDDDYEIVTTDYGWRGAGRGKKFSQRAISKEFFDAVTSHPKFNAAASWREMNERPDPARRLVAFLDLDTCLENNYPTYGTQFEKNLAIAVPGEKWSEVLDKSCVYIKRAAESAALRANPKSRLVLLDCGNGPWYRLMDVCGPESNSAINGGGWGNLLNNTQVIIAYYGTKKQSARPIDIGLPAPAIKPATLSAHERHWIATCHPGRRRLLFSFQGQGGFRRDRLALLDNGDDVYVRIRDGKSYWNKTGDFFKYADVLRDSLFAAAPKGDCLYSYRFAEVMSAGAVPVVYANHWLPPFSSTADPDRVVNWTKCALFIGEGRMKYTMDWINPIPDDVRCDMQKCALAFWDEFGSSRKGWLKGILRWVNSDPNIAKSGAVRKGT